MRRRAVADVEVQNRFQQSVMIATFLAALTLGLHFPSTPLSRSPAPRAVASAPTAPIFTAADTNTEVKMRLLTLAAALDRGQSYNPTSSDAYSERMATMTATIEELVANTPALPTELSALDGEWELIFTNVAHGIFRSSPFFLAIEVLTRRPAKRDGAAPAAHCCHHTPCAPALCPDHRRRRSTARPASLSWAGGSG